MNVYIIGIESNQIQDYYGRVLTLAALYQLSPVSRQQYSNNNQKRPCQRIYSILNVFMKKRGHH